MSLDAGSMGALAAAIGVPLTFRALARVFPSNAAAAAVGLSLEELRPRYRKWELGFSFAATVVAVPTGLLIWLALRALGAAHASLLPSADIRWVAGAPFWGVPSIFLAITLMYPLFTWIERRLLGDRYPEYVAYEQLKFRMDTTRVARMVITFAALASAVFIFLGLDWSVRVDHDGLVVNSFLGLGDERHAFADVRAIRTAPALIAPNGNRVARREFVVTFDDGARLSTNNLLSDTSPEEKWDFASLVSRRSGVPVENVEVLRNDEL